MVFSLPILIQGFKPKKYLILLLWLHLKLTAAPTASGSFWIFISLSGSWFIIYELLRSYSIFRLFLSSPPPPWAGAHGTHEGAIIPTVSREIMCFLRTVLQPLESLGH